MQISSPGRLKIFNLIALLTVFGSALSAVLQIDSILLRWQVILVLSLFMGLQFSLPQTNETLADLRKSNILIALQTLAVGYLVLRTGIGFPFLALFFILSMNVALYNSLPWVLAWIAGFTLVTAFLNVYQGGWERLVLETAVFSAGYVFFGVTTNALRKAQIAQAQNERLFLQQTSLVEQQNELLEELKLKNSQLESYAQQVETLAVVEERNRLSREMHDTLGHHLTSSAVQLEAAQRLLPGQSERAAAILGEVRQEVRQALAELRQVVGRLREPVETELDLPIALQRLVERFQSVTGLPVQLELPEEPCPMSPAQRLALFRAAQEGLTNLQRHANASQACMRLLCLSEEIRLELQDNGQGLAPEMPTSPPGFGLRGLQERALALGGETRLENAPGGGSILWMRFPRSLT